MWPGPEPASCRLPTASAGTSSRSRPSPASPQLPCAPRHPPSPHGPFPPASALLFLKCFRPPLGASIRFPFGLECPSNETLKCHPQS